MKRNQLVQKLIKEGFSEKTLVNFSDKQLYSLSERVLGEAVMKQVKVLSMANPKDAEEVNALVNDPKAVQNQVAQGHVQVTKEEKKLSKNQSNKMDTDKDGDIDSTDLKNLRNKKKKVKGKEDLSESLWGITIAAIKSELEKKLGRKPKDEEVEKEFDKIIQKHKSKDKESNKKEVKEWVNKLAESNFHSFTSKNEIMELIQSKMTQHEVGPNVKKGHNGVPEFMSYDAISKSEVKEDDTKYRKVSDGKLFKKDSSKFSDEEMKKRKEYESSKKSEDDDKPKSPREFNKTYKDWHDDKKSKSEMKEGGTKTKPAPTKPKTSPGTKPKTPYQPGPGKNPKPKALKEDK